MCRMGVSYLSQGSSEFGEICKLERAGGENKADSVHEGGHRALDMTAS